MIESTGAVEILSALRSNMVLRECHVSGNDVPIHLVQEIEAAVAENSGEAPLKGASKSAYSSPSRFSPHKENICENLAHTRNGDRSFAAAEGGSGGAAGGECSAKAVSRVRSELQDLSTKYQTQSYERTELIKELEFARGQAQVDAQTFDHERQQLLALIELQKESLAASEEHIRRLEQSTEALTRQMQCDAVDRDEGFRAKEQLIESMSRELKSAKQEMSRLALEASSASGGFEKRLAEARDLLEKQKAMHSSEKEAFKVAAEERERSLASELDEEKSRARAKIAELEKHHKMLQNEKRSLSADHDALKRSFDDAQSDFAERVEELETKVKMEQTKRASAESRAVAEVASKIQTVRDEMKAELERREAEYEEILEKCAKEQSQIREWLESEKTARNDAENALRTAHRDVDRSESALVQSKHRVALLEESVAERERHAADVRREHKEAVEQLMASHGRALSERESTLHQKEQLIVSLQQRVRALEGDLSRMAQARTSQEGHLSQALAALQRCFDFPSVQNMDFSRDPTPARGSHRQLMTDHYGQLNQAISSAAGHHDHSHASLYAAAAAQHSGEQHLYADAHSRPVPANRGHGQLPRQEHRSSGSPRHVARHTRTPSPRARGGLSRFHSEPQLHTPRDHRPPPQREVHAQRSPRYQRGSSGRDDHQVPTMENHYMPARENQRMPTRRSHPDRRSGLREKNADVYEHTVAHAENAKSRSQKSSPRRKPKSADAQQSPRVRPSTATRSPRSKRGKINEERPTEARSNLSAEREAKMTREIAPPRNDDSHSESDISFDCTDMSSPRSTTGAAATSTNQMSTALAKGRELSRARGNNPTGPASPAAHAEAATGGSTLKRSHTLRKASTMARLPTLTQSEYASPESRATAAAGALSPTARLAQSLSSDVLARAGISRLDLDSVQRMIGDGGTSSSRARREQRAVGAGDEDEDDDEEFSIQSDDEDGNSEFSVS